MTELQNVLEWLGTGLAGLLIIVVVWMVASLVTRGRRDQDWE
jgi:hypothetical protein